MKSTNLLPELFDLAKEANSQLSVLVSQPLWIDIVDSWSVRYQFDVNCNEEKEESLRLNVTFDCRDGGHFSGSTYISKTHSITSAMTDLNKYHSEYLTKMATNTANAAAKEKEQKIIDLVKEGKFDEAKALSESN